MKLNYSAHELCVGFLYTAYAYAEMAFGFFFSFDFNYLLLSPEISLY